MGFAKDSMEHRFKTDLRTLGRDLEDGKLDR